jgi:hypothetical protein
VPRPARLAILVCPAANCRCRGRFCDTVIDSVRTEGQVAISDHALRFVVHSTVRTLDRFARDRYGTNVPGIQPRPDRSG